MTHLIQIGNSRGIRIPKSMIHEAGLENADLALKVVPEGLLVTPRHSVRQGWAEACKTMHEKEEDKLLIDEKIVNRFDQEEWKW